MKLHLPACFTCLMAFGIGCSLTSAARAQVTLGNGYTPGDDGYAVSTTDAYFGDVFTAPASPDTSLTSLSAWYNNDSGDNGPDLIDTAVVSVYAWNANTFNTQGAALFTGTQTPTSALGEITFSGLNVALNPGSQYVITFADTTLDDEYNQDVYLNTNSNPGIESVYAYQGTFYSQPGYTADVLATFGPAGVTPVPEHSWMIWSGIGLFAGLAFWSRRRQAGAAAEGCLGA